MEEMWVDDWSVCIFFILICIFTKKLLFLSGLQLDAMGFSYLTFFFFTFYFSFFLVFYRIVRINEPILIHLYKQKSEFYSGFHIQP